MKKTIIIWGIGERTNIYMRHQYFRSCEIKGFVDSNKHGTTFYDRPVWEPLKLSELMNDTDYLVIANYFITEVFALCLDLGIEREKILFTDWIDEPFVGKNKEKILDLAPDLKEDLELNRYRLIEVNEKDFKDEMCQVGRGKYSHPYYMLDYFRYRSFEYISEILEEDGVQGNLAEFGVFRGQFSALINQRFPNRKLYLFDTFEGFEKEEMEKETAKGRCDKRFAEYHADTSVERVIKNLPFPEQCIVCKGFFPNSIIKDAMNEKFAFVSIDVDFEESILAGLDFFYPRLADGGVIYIHDYNSAFLSGVKNAVKRYEEKIGYRLRKVPFADRAGTIVVLK